MKEKIEVFCFFWFRGQQETKIKIMIIIFLK
jgi:hypothetical protein